MANNQQQANLVQAWQGNPASLPPKPPATVFQEDEENDEAPRQVLNLNGKFYTYPDRLEIPYKLAEADLVSVPCFDDGDQYVWVTPVLTHRATSNAKAAMGNGANNIWTASTWNLPEGYSMSRPRALIKPIKINSTNMTIWMTRNCISPPSLAKELGEFKTLFIYVGGFFLYSSPQHNPRGGWAFSFGPGAAHTVRGKLERKEVNGTKAQWSTKRAELRGLVAAVGYRTWVNEGFEKVVFVTSSEYAHTGATGMMRVWAENGWQIGKGSSLWRSSVPVQDRDLWEVLSGELGRHAEKGCEIAVWKVCPAWNDAITTEAHWAAKLEPDRIEHKKVVWPEGLDRA